MYVGPFQHCEKDLKKTIALKFNKLCTPQKHGYGQILFISKKFILLNIHLNVVKVKIERKALFSNNYYYQHERKKQR